MVLVAFFTIFFLILFYSYSYSLFFLRKDNFYRISCDRDKLAEAKEMVYLKGFYEGKMIVGDHKGKSVQVGTVV